MGGAVTVLMMPAAKEKGARKAGTDTGLGTTQGTRRFRAHCGRWVSGAQAVFTPMRGKFSMLILRAEGPDGSWTKPARYGSTFGREFEGSGGEPI